MKQIKRWLAPSRHHPPPSPPDYHLKLNHGHPDPSFSSTTHSNVVISARYTLLTFLPMFLFSYFARPAYIYFLLQAALAWIKVISPFSGVGQTTALVFVLAVGAIKEIVEDKRRHTEDARINATRTRIFLTHEQHRDRDEARRGRSWWWWLRWRRQRTSQPSPSSRPGEVHDAWWHRVTWRDVRMGHIIELNDDEYIPADCLLLTTTHAEQIAYVKTTQLDGETNLKVKTALPLSLPLPSTSHGEAPRALGSDETRDALASSLRSLPQATLQYESPRIDMHHFHGTITLPSSSIHPDYLQHEEQVEAHDAMLQRRSAGLSPLPPSPRARTTTLPLTMDHLLLRGSQLKNTGRAAALVLYVGRDTRIQRNATRRAPPKIGAYDSFLNVHISFVILLQLVLCAIFAGASIAWRKSQGVKRYHLGLDPNAAPGQLTPDNVYSQGNVESDFVQWLLDFLMMWILLSYLVPISLFVTLEIVKGIQGLIFIPHDVAMMSGGECARARRISLLESLGKVSYIFADKTGTLTANEMVLKCFSIDKDQFGATDKEEEEEEEARGEGAASLASFDPRLAERVTQLVNVCSRLDASPFDLIAMEEEEESIVDARNLVLFFLCVTCCHSVIVEPTNMDETGVVDQQQAENGGSENGKKKRRRSKKNASPPAPPPPLSPPPAPSSPPKPNKPLFSGPSPDEVALLHGVALLGFILVARPSRNTLVLSFLGHECQINLLQTIEFTSERRMMSVVIELTARQERIVLVCSKGADVALLPRDPSGARVAMYDAHLEQYASRGLRTLVISCKLYRRHALASYDLWAAQYRAAERALQDRTARLDALAAALETDLVAVGVAAVEDRLQEGVPEALVTLLRARIRVWMITGDKRETAINIAVSCGLFGSSGAEHRRIVLQATSLHDVQRQLCNVHTQDGELVVDGVTLSHILRDDAVKQQFATCASSCRAVVVCRASPSQKADIVRLVSNHALQQARGESRYRLVRAARGHAYFTKNKTLAIGDGANDVAMLQVANVGVGIAGREGRQAAQAADFSIPSFHHLVRLLLLHGHWCEYRLGKLIKYSYYKNVAFAFVLAAYQFFSGFSGQALVTTWLAALYNALLTAAPIALLAVTARPVRYPSTLLDNPSVYNHGASLTPWRFWSNLLTACIDGAICLFIPLAALAPATKNGASNDLASFGATVFLCLLTAVTLEVLLITRFVTRLLIATIIVSLLLGYTALFYVPSLQYLFGGHDDQTFGLFAHVLTSGWFWMCILATASIVFLRRFTMNAARWLLRPSELMRLALAEREGGGGEGL